MDIEYFVNPFEKGALPMQFLKEARAALSRTENVLTLNFKKVGYANTALLGALLFLRDDALAANKVIVLKELAPVVAELLASGNFGQLFEIQTARQQGNKGEFRNVCQTNRGTACHVY